MRERGAGLRQNKRTGMIDIVRRDVIRGAGALGFTCAIGSYAIARPLSGTDTYQFFTPQEAAFVEAAVDRLIPPEPVWSGAGEAGVPRYIDLQLAGPYGCGDRLYLAGPIRQGVPGQGYQLGLTPAQLYRAALQGIAAESQRRGLEFASASDADKDAFLQDLEHDRVRIADFSSAIFFETLLANTIEGYFADPVYGGNRDMVAWRMIGFPGAYAAYLGVYTLHGIDLRREPLSMAQADGHGASHHRGPAGTTSGSPDRPVAEDKR